MPNTPRLLVLRANRLEMIISVVAIGLGIFMWVSMNGSNSGVNLLAGAAFLVGGFVVFIFAMKAVLKY